MTPNRSVNRPGTRVVPTVVVALAAALLAVGCGAGDDVSSRGSIPGTAPVISSPGGIYGSNGGTLPPPIAVPTLEGISLKLDKVAEVYEPIALVPRSTTNNLYVAQKDGKVKVIAVDKQMNNDGSLRRVDYRVDGRAILDVGRSTDDLGQRGLLGLTFSSDGQRLYVLFTQAKTGAIQVDEYRMNDDAVDTRSKRAVFTLEHPEGNNNGGQILFGPDGFLYLGIGDGGGEGDVNKHGQNTKVLYGKILRIDPEGGTKEVPYGAPAGNPFHDGQQGSPEVWAFGVRNPWRFSFDRLTKDLWVADVGQSSWEEVNFLPAQPAGAGRGVNLGWSQLEGNHPFNGGETPPGAVFPIFEYPHGNGFCSIIGGFVYRGKTIWTLLGVYVYADYCEGEVHGLLRKADGQLEDRGFGLKVPNGFLEGGGSVTSFGEDNDGELYVLSAAGGIYKISAA